MPRGGELVRMVTACQELDLASQEDGAAQRFDDVVCNTYALLVTIAKAPLNDGQIDLWICR